MPITEGVVSAALATVRDPATGRDIVSAGLVQGLTVSGSTVRFVLEVAPEQARDAGPMRAAAESAVRAIPGVTSVTAVLTAHAEKPPARGVEGRPAHTHGQPAAAPARTALPGIRYVVAVASGKGGVGKSTVAANLALGLARLGLRTGLLDADIYGPSVPKLLGLNAKPESENGKRLIPLEAFGLKAMSIGLLVDVDTPMVWRGPMATSALQQMLTDVAWAPLDVLVVDMPPGTGDVQLTMVQRVPLAGGVIVSTPQDLALIDARKAIAMFQKTHVPILGLVENMSAFACPACGHESHIFGHGGAERTAAQLGVPFLGHLPLTLAIRERSDAGEPIVAAAPESAEALAFMALAQRVAETLAAGTLKAPPAIRFV